MTYSLRVTAVDTSGNESACSNEVTSPAQPDPVVTPIAQLYEAEDATLASPMTLASDPNALGGQYISPTSGTTST